MVDTVTVGDSGKIRTPFRWFEFFVTLVICSILIGMIVLLARNLTYTDRNDYNMTRVGSWKIFEDSKTKERLFFRVSSTTMYKGMPCLVYVTENQKGLSTVEFTNISKNETTTLRLDLPQSNGASLQFNPPFKGLILPIRNKAKWAWNGDVVLSTPGKKGPELKKIQRMVSVEVAGEEIVSLPAGKFRCFKLKFTSITAGKQSESIRWINKKLGVVKEATLDNKGEPSSTNELLDYEL